MRYDAVVIGGGHNGLTCAAYLARAGRKTLVLERRHVLGGAAVSEQVFPGFTFSVCSYVVSLLRPEIIRDLDLPAHGLELLPLDGTFTPMPNGDHLWRVNDHAKTRREIARHSKLDADAYDEYGMAMIEMGRFAKPILGMTPPDPMSLDPRGLLELLGVGRRFQKMRYHDRVNQVQLLTMSAVDFLDQWFETDVLKATMSASGIIGTFLGVRSPGTAYVLLHHYMGEIDGAFRSWGLSRGGTGTVSNAIAGAARKFGAEIRTEAPVAHIKTRGGQATGVVLENGDEIAADVVVSSVDPRLTFERFLDPKDLPDDFMAGVRRYKYRGSSGKVNLALDGLPDFTCLPGSGEHLRGAISISPSIDYMERAYDEAEVRTLLDPSVHRHRHPVAHRRFAGAARQARHVVLRAVRAVSPGRRHLGRPARGVRRRGRQCDRRARAEPPEPDPASSGADAARHRADVRPERGQHLPGRALAGAALLPAAGARLGAVRHAAVAALPMRLVHPPGGRHHGRTGQERRRANPQGRPAMSAPVVVIGGGVNGLVCATLLARAGRRVTLVERRPEVGGAAVTRQLAPGFRVPALAHHVGPLRTDVARDLDLGAHGLEFVPGDAWMTALDGRGRALTLWHDPARAARAIGEHSSADAARWPAFVGARETLGRVVASVFDSTPPSMDAPSARELWRLLHTARKFRGLGRDGGYRLLRWGPMAVADLVAEHADTPLLRAALAADGVFGSMLGPWSAGSGLLFLLHAANDVAGDARSTWPRGGPGAVADALKHAAEASGVSVLVGAASTRLSTRPAGRAACASRTGACSTRRQWSRPSIRNPPSRCATRWRCRPSCAGAPRTTGPRARSPR